MPLYLDDTMDITNFVIACYKWFDLNLSYGDMWVRVSYAMFFSPVNIYIYACEWNCNLLKQKRTKDGSLMT